MGKTVRIGLFFFILAGIPAGAQDFGLDAIGPIDTEILGTTLTVGGAAQGTIFAPFQPKGKDSNKITPSGAATLNAALKQETDSGLTISLQTAFQLYHDRFSGDNYGNDLVQKVYGRVQTGLGNLEIGMNDGAAFALAVGGPTVDSEAGLDNPNATFSRNPDTGRSFADVFALNGAVEPSYNFAKISYYTPKLFGVQVGASYTPSQAKDVLPFVSSGPVKTNRQDSIWETAVRYDDSLGPFAVQLSGGAAFSHADKGTETPGHAGLTDWAMGSQLSYPINEQTKFSLGGSYHRSNAYAFDPTNVLSDGATRSTHFGMKLENGPWAFGLEYGNGAASGAGQDPDLKLQGYGAALGVTLNDNWAGTFGWQELRYNRDSGSFYTGQPRVDLDALFLHLHFQVQ